MLTRVLAASLIVLTVGCSGITSAKTNFPEAWNVNSSEEDRAKYCDAAQNEGLEKYINDNMRLVGVFVASQKPEKLAEFNAMVKKLYGGSVKGFAAYATEQCKTRIAPTTTVAPTTTTIKAPANDPYMWKGFGFSVDPVIAKTECFASAGAVITYTPTLRMRSFVADWGSNVKVTYTVYGDQSGPKVQTMTVDRDSTFTTMQYVAQTASCSDTLTADVTSVDVYLP